MKKTPDTLLAMVLLFFVGLAISGFASINNDANPGQRSMAQTVERF